MGFFKIVGTFSGDFPALIGDFPPLVNIDGLLVFISTTPDTETVWRRSL